MGLSLFVILIVVVIVLFIVVNQGWIERRTVELAGIIIGIAGGIAAIAVFIIPAAAPSQTPESNTSIPPTKPIFHTPIATPKFTPSLSVTDTPTIVPTNTPAFSSTPIPTRTPTPTLAIEDGVFKFSDEFDGTTYGFDSYGSVRYANNSVEISQKGGITLLSSLSEGMGMVFLLKSTPGEFNCYLANKPSHWNYYVGVKTNTGYDLITSIGLDSKFIGGEQLDGNLSFSPNRWYFVMVKILEAGTFYIRVWEKDNPLNYGEKGVRLGPKWEEQEWYPHAGVTTGQIIVDYYQELEFKY